jgi:dihydrofolate synthase/folylpolyglutamate synthase
MNILGNTMQDIAGEKAGIIKKNIPVVIGERQKEIESVFIEKAKKESAPLFFASDRFEIQKAIKKKNWLEVIVRDNMSSTTETYQLDLTANYQTKNLCTVLQSISLLQQNFSIDEKVVNSALRRVKEITGFFGRWEVIHDTPKIVLDVAHNEAGIREMIKQLKTEFFNQLHLVIGMVKDKDITAVLQMFPVNAFYYFTQTNIPRALSEEELKEKAFAFGLKGESYANVNDALKAAKSKASSNDLILVCGSIFLVSEVDISLLKTEGGQSLPTHT